MDLIFAGLEVLYRWDVALALLVGSIGGVMIGAVPGVVPAILIPTPGTAVTALTTEHG